MAYTHFHTANLHVSRNDAQATRTAADALVALAAEQELLYWLPRAKFQLGWSMCADSQSAHGLAQMSTALEAFRNTQARLQLPMYLTLLASALGTAGRFGEGHEMLDEADHLVARLGELIWSAESKRTRGEILLMQSDGHHAAALACFTEALEIAERQRARSLELRAAISMARLLRDLGETSSACELLDSKAAWFRGARGLPDLERAEDLLGMPGSY